MRRIGLAVVLALGLTLASLAAEAQAPKVYRIGFLALQPFTDLAPYVAALRQGLREHAYVEGQNLVIESRFADDSMPIEDIRNAIRPLKARQEILTDERGTLKDAGALATLDSAALRRDLLATVQDVRTLFGTETQQSRALLRRLLDSPIKVTPYRDGSKKGGWKFSGSLNISRLMTGEAIELFGSVSGSAAVSTGGRDCRPATFALPFHGEVAA